MRSNGERTTAEVLARGWTRTLIRRFLPKEDGRAAVAHWANFRGTNTYLISRLKEIERSQEFGDAFLRSWRGRMNGRPPEAALEELRARAD